MKLNNTAQDDEHERDRENDIKLLIKVNYLILDSLKELNKNLITLIFNVNGIKSDSISV